MQLVTALAYLLVTASWHVIDIIERSAFGLDAFQSDCERKGLRFDLEMIHIHKYILAVTEKSSLHEVKDRESNLLSGRISFFMRLFTAIYFHGTVQIRLPYVFVL
jgi:hypothetical protein